MERTATPPDLRPFLDDEGRLTQWPARQKIQRQAIGYLASRFEHGWEYDEKTVNEILCAGHTFGDWALLRRLLFNWGYMDREADGTRYRLRTSIEE